MDNLSIMEYDENDAAEVVDCIEKFEEDALKNRFENESSWDKFRRRATRISYQMEDACNCCQTDFLVHEIDETATAGYDHSNHTASSSAHGESTIINDSIFDFDRIVDESFYNSDGEYAFDGNGSDPAGLDCTHSTVESILTNMELDLGNGIRANSSESEDMAKIEDKTMADVQRQENDLNSKGLDVLCAEEFSRHSKTQMVDMDIILDTPEHPQ